MKIIRNNVFETNSSSMHSISLDLTNENINMFNMNKLFYYSGTKDLTIISENFYKLEEIYNLLIKLVKIKNLKDIRLIKYEIPNNIFNIQFPIFTNNLKSKILEKIYKQYIMSNLSIDLVNYAYGNTSKINKYRLSKTIVKQIFQLIFYFYGKTPLLTKTDFSKLACSENNYDNQVHFKNGNLITDNSINNLHKFHIEIYEKGVFYENN